MEEEKGFYRGEKASMETTAVADLADTENICLYIEEMNSKEGVHTKCAVDSKPFPGTLLEDSTKDLSEYMRRMRKA